MKAAFPKLYYISQAETPEGHVVAIRRACEMGCKWIQLRIKNEPEMVVLKQAVEAKKMCREFGASLFINDFPMIALAVNAAGVHLGKEDLSAWDARFILGDKYLIGGTANTFMDVRRLADECVDYIGLGPFRFTKTKDKDKLAPVLGLEGYEKIIRQCADAGIQVPIYAIGGVEKEDVETLMKTGIYGIAVSSMITFANDSTGLASFLNEKLNPGYQNFMLDPDENARRTC